jgi:phage tail-like protein
MAENKKKLPSLVKPVTTPRPKGKLPPLVKDVTTPRPKGKLTTKAKKYSGATTKGKLTTKAKKYSGATTKGKLTTKAKKYSGATTKGKLPTKAKKFTGDDLSYPLPMFHFKVEIENMQGHTSFQKVSGLEAKTNFVKYSHGNTKQSHDYNIPGRTVFTDVTLEKGIFVGDKALYEWWKENLSVPSKKAVTIMLLNPSQDTAITWTLNDAMPVQITFSELDSQKTGSPAIEKLILKCNTIDVS